MAARITLGIATVLLLAAIWMGYAFGARYMLFGEKAIGTVVELRDDGSSISPVVSFVTRNGETRQYEGLGAGEPDYYVGERVAMRYFEDDATASRISSSFHELWLPGLVIGIVGTIFGLVGLVMRRVEGSFKPTQAAQTVARAQRRSSSGKASAKASRKLSRR